MKKLIPPKQRNEGFQKKTRSFAKGTDNWRCSSCGARGMQERGSHLGAGDRPPDCPGSSAEPARSPSIPPSLPPSILHPSPAPGSSPCRPRPRAHFVLQRLVLGVGHGHGVAGLPLQLGEHHGGVGAAQALHGCGAHTGRGCDRDGAEAAPGAWQRRQRRLGPGGPRADGRGSSGPGTGLGRSWPCCRAGCQPQSHGQPLRAPRLLRQSHLHRGCGRQSGASCGTGDTR